MKTIVVFGATGKVGCYTTLYLKEKGYTVIAVGKRKSDNGFFADNGIHYESVDIMNMSPTKGCVWCNPYGCYTTCHDGGL